MPRFLSVYAAGLISAVGTFVGSVAFPSVFDEVAAEFSGEAVGVETASGVALGFAFSSEVLTASSRRIRHLTQILRLADLLTQGIHGGLQQWIHGGQGLIGICQA